MPTFQDTYSSSSSPSVNSYDMQKNCLIQNLSLFGELQVVLHWIFSTAIFPKKASEKQLDQNSHAFINFIYSTMRKILDNRFDNSQQDFYLTLIEEITKWNQKDTAPFKFPLTCFAKIKIFLFHFVFGWWGFEHYLTPLTENVLKDITSFIVSKDNQDVEQHTHNILQISSDIVEQILKVLDSYQKKKEALLENNEESLNIQKELQKTLQKNLQDSFPSIVNNGNIYNRLCEKLIKKYFPKIQISKTIRAIANLDIWQPETLFATIGKCFCQGFTKILCIVPLKIIKSIEKRINAWARKKITGTIQELLPNILKKSITTLQIFAYQKICMYLKLIYKAKEFHQFLEKNFTNPNAANNLQQKLQQAFQQKNIATLIYQDLRSLATCTSFECIVSFLTFHSIVTSNIETAKKGNFLFQQFTDNITTNLALSTFIDIMTFLNTEDDKIEHLMKSFKRPGPESTEELPRLFPDITDSSLRKQVQQQMQDLSKELYFLINLEPGKTQEERDNFENHSYLKTTGPASYLLEQFSSMPTKIIEEINIGLVKILNQYLHPIEFDHQLTFFLQNFNSIFNPTEAVSKQQLYETTLTTFGKIFTDTSLIDTIQKIGGKKLEESKQKSWVDWGKAMVAQNIVATNPNIEKIVKENLLPYSTHILEGACSTIENNIIIQAVIDRLVVYFLQKTM